MVSVRSLAVFCVSQTGIEPLSVPFPWTFALLSSFCPFHSLGLFFESSPFRIILLTMRLSSWHVVVPWAVLVGMTTSLEADSVAQATVDNEDGAPALSRWRLVARAECRTATVHAGDGCWAVADRCKISNNDLINYNPRPNLCRTLAADEKVCCSPGTLPSSLGPGKPDGTCETRRVERGDGCGSLASKCGISPRDFMAVNTKANLCSGLAIGQHVCCTRGELPDLRSKPAADGSCATHTTNAGDSCSKFTVGPQTAFWYTRQKHDFDGFESTHRNRCRHGRASRAHA